MKKFIKNFLLLIFLTTCFSSINAEYIYYKKVANNIQKALEYDEHKKIYPILNKMFPISIKHILEIKKELSEEEFAFLCTNEREFLEDRMQKKLRDKSVRVAFIPTTLYEMLYMKFWGECVLDGMRKQGKKFIDMLYRYKRRVGQLSYQEIKQYYMDIPLAPFIIVPSISETSFTHLEMNKKLVEYFSERQVEKIDCRQLYSEICELFDELRKEKKKGQFYSYLFMGDGIVRMLRFFVEENRRRAAMQILPKAVAIEFEAHKLGAFVIYRGTCGFENRLDKIKKKKIFDSYGLPDGRNNKSVLAGKYTGLSYGSTLLAGLLGGDYGAVAFNYITKERSSSDFSLYGYGLLINKKEFFEESSFISRILYMPSHSTLSGWGCTGEDFHPRIYDDRLLEGENEKTFQDFLSKNARIIKNVSKNISNEELLSSYQSE